MTNMVEVKSYGAPQKQILLADGLAFTMGAIIKATGVTADSNSKKIIKAGTPMTGDLLKRQAGFSKGTAADAIAVLLHDVDVTDGDANGTIIISGFVDLDRLDKDIQDMYTTANVGNSKVTVVRGNDQIVASRSRSATPSNSVENM